jgi:hypothetical protein
MTEVVTPATETEAAAAAETPAPGTAIDLDKPLRLYPLTYLEEGDEVTVGRADINSYGLFPADGAELLRKLEAGVSPAAAARWYSEQYGEQVDMTEFIEVLEEFELIVKDGARVEEAAPVRWQRLGRALFSPVAWACYAALVIGAVVAMLRDSSLMPTYQHLFFTRSSLVILTLGIVLGQAPWVLIHEAFHALAGRRLGLNSTLRIDRRFYYLVFITSLDGLVAVPRRKRYLPMLAGMMFDVVAIAGLTLLAGALHSTTGAWAYVDRLLLAMAFGVVLRFTWQFYFFLRTDLYYLACTVLGCNDLQTAARQLNWNRINRVLRRTDKLVDEDSWHPRDRAVARWYSWLMAAGYGVLLALLVTAIIPAGVRVTEMAVRKVGTNHTPLNVLDVVVFLILNFGEITLAGILALRARARARAARRTGVKLPA